MIPDGLQMLHSLQPEIILIVGGIVVLLTGLAPPRATSSVAFVLSMLTAGLALWWSWTTPVGSGLIAGLRDDSLVYYARALALGVGLLILLSFRHVPEPNERAEFFSLTLFSLAGISLVAVANDLVLMFLALELVSVPTYILIGLSRRDIRAQEATGKYFFLGAFAAAITLYGFSFLYGAAGTTTLFSAESGVPSIAAYCQVPSKAADPMFVLGLLLTIAGLAFKLAAIPLHFYVADVYQGAAHAVTGMLGFVPKFAGILALARVLSLTGWKYGEGLFWLIWVMAAGTMLVGNTLALMQHNVKRMLAYSSVAHSGYMLVGLLAGPGSPENPSAGPLSSGLTAVLFYMAVYAVMNLGAFAVLSLFRKPGEGEEDAAETLDDLAGVATRHPWGSLALAVCVLSLMGMPPTGGFFGKLYVFSAALSSNVGTPREGAMLVLVIVGVLNSAIAAAYYLRIIAALYLRPVSDAGRRIVASPCMALRTCVVICTIVVLLVFVRSGPILSRSQAATRDLQSAPGWSGSTADASAEGLPGHDGTDR